VLLTGMVAKACHSVSGAVDTRIVLVGGICVYGNVSCISRDDRRYALMGTRQMRNHGRMMRVLVKTSSQSQGCAYSGAWVSGARVAVPV
jgi:hypothetical protein